MREKLSHVYRGGVLQETYVDHDKNMIDIVTTYIGNAPSEMTEEEFQEIVEGSIPEEPFQDGDK